MSSTERLGRSLLRFLLYLALFLSALGLLGTLLCIVLFGSWFFNVFLTGLRLQQLLQVLLHHGVGHGIPLFSFFAALLCWCRCTGLLAPLLVLLALSCVAIPARVKQ